MTSDPQILKIISGFSLPLVDFEQQKSTPFPLKFTPEEEAAADLEIEKLLAKNAIMECHSISSDDFVSTVFLRPKKTGGFHMILNLKSFNDYVEYQHFKMETIKDILASIVPNCFMAVADLQDAYLVIPIARWHWRFLKFRWKGKIYCYLVLPFGLPCSPRVFTKIAKVPLSVVRSKGHIALMYIDDGFIMGETFQLCWDATQCFLEVFVNAGFLPHPEKCCLWPSQEVQVLGFIVNSVTMTITIPQEKMQEIYDLCRSALLNPRMQIRQLCRLIGKLISVILAIPLGQAHYRRLEHVKNCALSANSRNFDAHCKISKMCFPDLHWWMNHIFHASAPIRRPPPDVTLYTDSSSFGWGAALFDFRAQGKFLLEELPFSINTKTSTFVLDLTTRQLLVPQTKWVLAHPRFVI